MKDKINYRKTNAFYLCLILFFAVLTKSKTYGQIEELAWPIEIVSEGHGFTEGPAIAQDGRVFFTDMDNNYILLFDPITNTTDIWSKYSGKANGLFIHHNYLYACEAIGRSVVSYNLNKGPISRKVLVSTFQGDSLGNPNDLTLIGDYLYFSEFWLGISNPERKREVFLNRVYRMSLEYFTLDTLTLKFGIPNGVSKSPNGKELFISDSQTNKLYKAVIKDGEVGALYEFADISKYGLNTPDGLAVDSNGYIFLALYGSGNLIVIDSDGNAIGYLSTGPLTSNCTFAADGKTLYITANKKLMRVVVPKIKK